MSKPMAGFDGINPGVLAAWRKARPIPAPSLPDPGPAYLSLRQIAQLWGMSPTHAGKLVRDMMREGRADKAVRPMLRKTRFGTAGYSPIPVYRLKEPKRATRR